MQQFIPYLTSSAMTWVLGPAHLKDCFKLLKFRVGCRYWLFVLCYILPATSQQNFWQQTTGPLGGYITFLAVDLQGEVLAGVWGRSVFRSTDEGGSWTQFTPSGTFYALSIDPQGRIFAGRSDGAILRSTDGGSTWSEFKVAVGSIMSLAINRYGDIFAGTVNEGVLRSIDKGITWTSVNTGLAEHSIERVAIIASGAILIGTSNSGVFRSTDNGDTWSEANNGFFGPFSNPSQVLSFGIHPKGDVLVGIVIVQEFEENGEIFRSTNDGENWYETQFPNAWAVDLAINSEGEIFAACVGLGVFLSTDQGETWTNVSTGLMDNAVGSVVIGSSGFVYAGTYTSGVFRSIQSTTLVGEGIPVDAPTGFKLLHNYPNPFNSTTSIRYELPTRSHVVLKIYNLLGQQVATLVDEEKEAGIYHVRWVAQGMASGVYFSRLHAANFSGTKKLLLLK